jgi:hypothetical protein
MDMTSLEKTSTQDRKGKAFLGSSFSYQHSAGSQSIGPSSYWSVAERHDFKTLLAHFGKDLEGISGFMETKTPVMVRSRHLRYSLKLNALWHDTTDIATTQVRNYYNRRLDAGEVELEEVVRDAETRKSRGESPHPLTISNAATQKSVPDYQMDLFLFEQQERDRREHKLQNLKQKLRMPITDPFFQSETKGGTQRRKLGEEDITRFRQRVRYLDSLRQRHDKVIIRDPVDSFKGQQDDQRQQEMTMHVTESNNSQVPEKNSHLPDEPLVIENVSESGTDSSSLVGQANSTGSSDALDTPSKQVQYYILDSDGSGFSETFEART